VLARRFRKKSFILNAQSLKLIFNHKLAARQNHRDENKNLFESMEIGTPSYNTAAADLLSGPKWVAFAKLSA
jgi:hypothetical protein